MSDFTDKELSTLLERELKEIRSYFDEFIRVYQFSNQLYEHRDILLKIHNCQCYAMEINARCPTKETVS